MVKSLGALLALLALCAPAVALARDTYEAPYVTCAPAYQTAALGSTARFFAVSNVEGSFTWVVGDEYSVRDLGAEFYAEMHEPGEQQVAVVWGSRRSYCTVLVTGYGYQAGQYGYTNSPLNVVLTSVAYPSWPNAGFSPQTLAGLAFALVLLLGASIALYPHVRKAFAIVAR